MDSTSIVGVPPMYTVAPSGTSISRSCSTTRVLSSRSPTPADRTVTPSLVGCEILNRSVSPSTPLACWNTSPTARGLPPSWMTSFTGSVRMVGKSSSKRSCAVRVSFAGGR